MQSAKTKSPVFQTVIFVALMFVVLSIYLIPPQFGNPAIGPKMERDVNQLLNRNSQTLPLPEGWRAQGVDLTESDVTVVLRSDKKNEAVVRLSHLLNPDAGVVVGQSRSFKLQLLKANGPEAKKAALSFCNRVKKSDRIYFFSSKNMVVSETWWQFQLKRYILNPAIRHKRVFTILLSCAILFLLVVMVHTLQARGILKNVLPDNASGKAALLAIFILGLFLRLHVSPSAPIHCNNHGVREIKSYLSMSSPLAIKGGYGKVFPFTIRRMLYHVGQKEENLFLINKIFGALAVLSIFLFAKGITGSDIAGCLSALFFCVSPAQVWMAGTEYQTPMYQFTGMAGLGLLCASTRERDISALWLSAILIAFASSLRILTILIAPVAVGTVVYLVFLDKEKLPARFSKHLAACFAIVAAFALLHSFSIPAVLNKGWSESSPLKLFFLYGMSFRNTILDPTLTPFAVPLAALAAYLLAWKSDKKFAVFATALFIIAIPLTFSVLDCRTTALRYQSQGHWLYYIAAALLFTNAAPKFIQQRQAALVAGMAILAIAGSIPGLAMLYRGDEEINEYRFIRKTAVEIPPGAVIRLPVYHVKGRTVKTGYPDYINNHIVVKGRNKNPGAKKEIIYIGLDCYRSTVKQGKDSGYFPKTLFQDGKNKQCIDVCKGRLSPLYETQLDAAHPAIGYHDRFFQLGTKKPVIGFYRCGAE